LAAEPEERGAVRRISPGKLLALVGTIVGLVSGIAGLVFLFRPDLQPRGEAAEQAATLSKLTVDQDASFAQYLARIDQPPTDYGKQQLARRGALLQFRIHTTGFKGEELVIKWELFEEASGEQVDESKDISLTPDHDTNEANWHFWVPLSNRQGEHYAVVELLQQREDHLLALDTLQTEPFPGLRG
jgi:hypothetical protein